MEEFADSAAPASGSGEHRFFVRPPLAAWIVALLAAMLHMFPVWRAQSQVRPGFEFTGNVSISPDQMQYRGWARRSQETGLLVDNQFTSEPSRPYLPVALYWTVGRLARVLDLPPEAVYAYTGALLAAVLVLLLFLTTRYFLGGTSATWWVLGVMLLGGGVGAHLRMLQQIQWVQAHQMLSEIVNAVDAAPVFDSYRSHYLFKTLFDTHFLLIWVVTLAALLALYFAVKRPGAAGWALTAALFAAITLLHVYEGFTLLSVCAFFLLLCTLRRLRPRAALNAALCATAATIVCLVVLLRVYRASGIPLPTWRPEHMTLSNLVLGFPVAWPLIAWGIGGYWRRAGLAETFLLSWALGLTVFTLSGPYNPFAPRGPLTLQVPVHLIAGAIWFQRNPRVPWRAVLVVVALLGATPALELQRLWDATRFDPRATHMFLDPDHRQTIELLRNQAQRDDVLLADYRQYRWLAPEHPGRCYHAHFFLTVDFERKEREVARFFESTPAERARFLQRERVRFLYVESDRDPASFEQVPGLVPLQRAEHGWLFRFQG